MASFTGKDTYKDYTYDDEMENEFYDEEDESEISLMESISGWVSKIPNPFKRNDEDLYDELDEYDDTDDEYEEEVVRKKPIRSVKASKKYDDEAEKMQNRDGYTREDYDSYDKKYGTRGSYARAEQSEKNRAKVFAGNRAKKRVPESGNVTKLYEEEKYKGNVKGVLKFAPKSIDDTNDIADSLMNQYAVLVDLKGMAKGDILRILDFIDGVAYVLKYNFDEISKEIYMCAPKGFLKNFTRYNHD